MAETIGQQLKFARLVRNLSIEKVVEATHIRPQYIEAMEADNYDIFPSPAQGRGFLNNYADFLGLKLEDLYVRKNEQPSTPLGTPGSIPAPENVTVPVWIPESASPPATLEPPEIFTSASETMELHLPPTVQEETATVKKTRQHEQAPLPQAAFVPSVKRRKKTSLPKEKSTSPGKPGKKKTLIRRPLTEILTPDKKAATIQPVANKSTGKKQPVVKPIARKVAPVKGKTVAGKAVEQHGSEKKPPDIKPIAEEISAPVAKGMKKPSATGKRLAPKPSEIIEPADESAFPPETYHPPPIAAIQPFTPKFQSPDQGIFPEETTSIIETLPEAEAPADVTLPAISSKDIFLAIGTDLRQRRELLGLTLDEVERHIHVRSHYLEAIETGDISSLPSPVQARGMLNNYTRFLDMDSEALLLRFADGLQVHLHERHPPTEEKPGNKRNRFTLPVSLRRYLSIDLLLGGGLVIIFIIFVIWGVTRIISLDALPTPQPTAPSISDVLLVSLTPAVEASIVTPTAGPTLLPADANLTGVAATLPTDGNGRVHVIVVALERAYVVVTVDGLVKFDGRIVPDIAYPFDGRDRIEVLTANGAAVKIIYNGVDMGVMGTFGQIVDLVYGATTVMTPTPTSTPTPTATPIPSATPRPSVTPRWSATPRRTPTPIP